MSIERWSVEQVRAIAPDPVSARAGQGLGAPSQWSAAGLSDAVLWGICRTYQVAVDLDGPRFKCSCPSRKTPCKHALGLLFRWATVGVPDAAAPEWATFPARRVKSDAPPDPVAAAKRQAVRADRVAAGMSELGRWLDDQVQAGLAAAERGGYDPFDEMAARLVDAQAPAAAATVRRLGGLVGSGPHWADRVLGEMGLLRLLVDGHDRLDELPSGLAASVRTRIGFPTSTSDVLAGPRVTDRWRVLGRVDAEDGNLQSRRIWLHGATTGRFALLLSFAAPGQSLPSDVVPGRDLDADLCFYPGTWPLRALIADRRGDFPLSAPTGVPIAAALSGWAAALAAEPWRPDVPVLLAGVRPAAPRPGDQRPPDRAGRHRPAGDRRPDDDWLIDEAGDALPLAAGFRHPWWLIAAGGGRPVTVAGEWSPAGLRPLGVWVDGVFVAAPEQTFDGPNRREPELPPDLLAAALVGTARRPWTPAPVAVGGRSLDLPAGSLLEAAGSALVYRRAGVRPGAGHRPIEAAPAETQPALPWAAGERLRRILTLGEAPFGSTATPIYLAEWLRLAQARGGRAPGGRLPGLLDQATTHEDLRAAVATVAGARGRWLAGMRDKWEWLLPAKPSSWDTGTADERVALLHATRLRDPDAGRRLIESTWEADPASDRARFLAELGHGLSLADATLLERSLDDRNGAVRNAGLELLRALPGSAWAGRMAARARAAVRLERRVIGRDRLVVTPPEELDAVMRRDGLTPSSGSGARSSSSGGGPPFGGGPASGGVGGGRRTGGAGAHRLEEIVAGTPLVVWAEYAKSPAAMIELARGDDFEDSLVHGWARAAIDQRDAAWASALVLNDNGGEGPALRHIVRWDLHGVLPATHLTRIVLDYLVRRDYQVSRLLTQLTGEWTDELATVVLTALRHGVRSDQDAWLVHELCPPAIGGLPTRYAPRVAQLAEELDHELGPTVRTRPIAELAAALAFRQEMHQEFG
ncbi:SWIM zinc finger family protein [Actinoplanes sp. NPDC049265]|uniref:SWIM zinc finger family protein n=1 Tax=Actinoplanes sp. NPDC049265 TaxID=3363902 RepID=UPI003722F57F